MIVKFIKDNSMAMLIVAAAIIILVAINKNKDYEYDYKNNWYPYNGWGENPFLTCRKSEKYPYNTECKFRPISKKPNVDPKKH